MSSYDGGKGGAGIYQWIINQIPPHRRYIDLFLGHSAVLRYKRPAEQQIGIELSERVIAEYWGCGIPDLTIICGDALQLLNTAGVIADIDEQTLIYADPPYLMETRSHQQQLYQFEFAEREQHIALLSRLKELPCLVAISGYYSDLYAELLTGWRTSTFKTVNRAGKPATEWLWMNYPKPLELHDYRYLGRNFRERERIKRKKQRWTARLRGMPDLERYALMEAVGELRSTIAMDGDIDEACTARNDDRARSGTAAHGDDAGAFLEVSPDLAMPAATVSSGDTHSSWPASIDMAVPAAATLAECDDAAALMEAINVNTRTDPQSLPRRG